jgi:hypothetical protein
MGTMARSALVGQNDRAGRACGPSEWPSRPGRPVAPVRGTHARSTVTMFGDGTAARLLAETMTVQCGASGGPGAALS